ncbi:unnamed protein product [Heterobilharzia americana]|nr:unnamed protein product [Heterobilharzia americana]
MQRSLQENEEVEFFVVEGDKGVEASDVTGPDRRPGSVYAANRPFGRSPREYGMRGDRDDSDGYRSNGFAPYRARGQGRNGTRMDGEYPRKFAERNPRDRSKGYGARENGGYYSSPY